MPATDNRFQTIPTAGGENAETQLQARLRAALYLFGHTWSQVLKLQQQGIPSFPPAPETYVGKEEATPS
ncbi:hypothetical protein SESBI_40451 [Sesbania bispinosa]|nr:hypothetical protein SESBI_40451 [Sesbania bispinosa]